MNWYKCSGDLDCQRANDSPISSTTVRISASVGRGGANRNEDVRKVQHVLNQVPIESGGSAPPLAEDGICGPLSTAAIINFQKRQFPEWQPDGLIDTDKWTIARLNQVLGKSTPLSISSKEFQKAPFQAKQSIQWPIPELLGRARAIAPLALMRVNNAIHRLSVIRSSYALPSRLFTNDKLKREGDWHFKFHKASDPVTNIDIVMRIYQRMNTALTKYVSGSFPLFQLADRHRADAIAYAHLGGYSMMLHERDSTGEQGAYIYISNERFGGLPVVIHELGHYSGGRFGSGEEISHVTTPHPKPNGAPKEDGRHNYLQMTPAEALRNVYSYQVFALPEMGYGPPEKGPF